MRHGSGPNGRKKTGSVLTWGELTPGLMGPCWGELAPGGGAAGRANLAPGWGAAGRGDLSPEGKAAGQGDLEPGGGAPGQGDLVPGRGGGGRGGCRARSICAGLLGAVRRGGGRRHRRPWRLSLSNALLFIQRTSPSVSVKKENARGNLVRSGGKQIKND